MMISELPDFPAVQQIKDALWEHGDVRGAAIMVGAGFSRLANLNTASTNLPPLWRDFSSRMEKQLYPNGGAPSDPLRLAQEYKAALGEAALDGLIRSLIQDDKWEPSKLHETLLSLPWSDVLTTNWDTLLERTELLEIERTYEIVRTPDDIARTRAPRIVKLHGSFPANKPFIFTEEDYRTYPKRFAPFVNLAQQVLLENELCLIGFSGDDPNFIQWAGWVRDNLGETARQIRLVGVLDLSPSRREMLKQQNVTPIDLAPLVKDMPNDVKHSKAISMFLDWLVSSKPTEAHVWKKPSEDLLPKPSTPDVAGPTLSEIASAWRQDRLKHPGWLITPGEMQEIFRYETDRYYPRLNKLDEEANVATKMRVLFELACRHEIAFWPLSKHYAKAIKKTFASGGGTELSQQEKTRLCAFLYAEARRRWDWESFDFWASQLEIFDGTEASTELLYGKALRAKQEFDYATLDELVPEIVGDDPVWKMRQGMLYAFLYEDEKAALCVQAALTDIRARRAKDKKSIWLMSREAWANWVFQSAWTKLPENKGKYYNDFGDWPAHYGQKKCDPWEYMSFVDRKAADAFEKIQSESATRTPLFDAGHFKNNAGGIHLVSHANVSALNLYTRLQEVAGIPSRIGYTNFLTTRLSRAFEAENREIERDFFAAAVFITDANKGLIDTAFNRIEVAKLPLKIVVRLAAALKSAVEYLLGKYTGGDLRLKSIERIRRNIELISRLSVRMSVTDALEYYQWALALCKQDAANDWWLYKHIGNLLERSLEALPKENKAALAETAIFLPLPGERNTEGIEHDWPEIIDKFDQNDFDRPQNGWSWSERIAELIEAVRVGNKLDRSRAILRMRVLYRAGLLEENEKGDLAKAIWSKTNEAGGWPSAHNLYPFIFLELPEVVKGQAEELFLSCVISKVSSGAVDVPMLHTINGGLKSSEALFERSRESFGAILETCMNWKPQAIGNDFVKNDIENLNDEHEYAIANFLANTLLPEMGIESVSPEVKRLWEEHLKNPENQYMVATAFEFSRLFPGDKNDAIRTIRKAIFSRSGSKIAFGYRAIQKFIEATRERDGEIPGILVTDVLSACESMKELGLNHVLYTATKLVDAGAVSDEGQRRLAETLEIIWSEYSYDVKIASEERAITLTLVRSECAKLAKSILSNEAKNEATRLIYEEAKMDPIPEVRNSV